MLKNHTEHIICLEFPPPDKTYSQTLILTQNFGTLTFDRRQGLEDGLR